MKLGMDIVKCQKRDTDAPRWKKTEIDYEKKTFWFAACLEGETQNYCTECRQQKKMETAEESGDSSQFKHLQFHASSCWLRGNKVSHSLFQ